MIPWYLDLQNKNRHLRNKSRFFKYANLIKNDTIDENQFIRGSFSYFKNPGSATIDEVIIKITFYLIKNLVQKIIN